MNTTERDLRATDSGCLRELADSLKADAKALYPHDRTEAMRLFGLWRRIAAELHRRRNPAMVHELN